MKRTHVLMILLLMAILSAARVEAFTTVKTVMNGENILVSSQYPKGFSPDVATIQAGQVIEWKNQDPYRHTIVIEKPADRFEPVSQKPLDRLEVNAVVPSKGKMVNHVVHKFVVPGRYLFFDGTHPEDRGIVIVKAAKSAGDTASSNK